MALTAGFQKPSVRRFGAKFRRDQDGATAVEFALISVPFFMMLFGIMSICQLYFWTFTTENAVWSASRDIRTGTFQTAAGPTYGPIAGNPQTQAQLITDFQTAICNGTVNKGDCMANSVVVVQAQTSFSNIVVPTAPNTICTPSGNTMITSSAAASAFNAGVASSVVLVTFCYSWKFGAKLPFLTLPKLTDGGYLIQASAAFRTEPY